MIYVLFSDIHGNQYAFFEFLRQLKNISYDAIYFCGDICGYYYGQDEISELMQTMPSLYAIRGNHDNYGILQNSAKMNAELLFEKYGHSYDMLSEKTLKYISGLPVKMEWEHKHKRYALFHGTPENVLEGRLYPNDDIASEIKVLYNQYDIVFSGHTHYRMDRQCGKTRIINPGSLGQQRDGKGFCYALYNTETEELSYREVIFPIEKLKQEVMYYDKENYKLWKILYRSIK